MNRPDVSEVLAALERAQRMERIQMWLDDVNSFADDLFTRAPAGDLQSLADNEWVWNERGRLLQNAAVLLKEILLDGIPDEK
jgi:hypothetical protein